MRPGSPAPFGAKGVGMAQSPDRLTRLFALALLVSACEAPVASAPTEPASVSISSVAISDLNSLYPGGNGVPALHASLGLVQVRRVTPLLVSGAAATPAAGGRIVFLGLGFSNMTQEWCTTGGLDGVSCSAWTLMGQARVHARVKTAAQGLRFFNGARSAQTIPTWDDPSEYNYDRLDSLLAARGLGPRQVQAVVLKVANSKPVLSLPSPGADAYDLARRTGSALRALRVRFPNLRVVFLLSRSYGGYATSTTNPEPFAYEGGVAIQRVIAAQVKQEQTGTVDSLVGDLSQAPFTVWGPYLWADGMHPRHDGLTWARTDFEADGLHPSQAGERKIGTLMLNYFLASPYSGCWISPGRVC